MDAKDLRIGSPCTLDWRKMTPADGGRFCGDCKKVVRDLSKLTEADARALIRSAGPDLCVRYLYDRDGTILFADAARPIPASFLSRAKRAAATAAALALPLALQACSVDLGTDALASPLQASPDHDTNRHDTNENMGGAPYIPDDDAPDASDDETPDSDAGSPDATDDASTPDEDADPDADAGTAFPSDDAGSAPSL